jgi:hypothetical protein
VSLNRLDHSIEQRRASIERILRRRVASQRVEFHDSTRQKKQPIQLSGEARSSNDTDRKWFAHVYGNMFSLVASKGMRWVVVHGQQTKSSGRFTDGERLRVFICGDSAYRQTMDSRLHRP